jgi:DNA-binding NtrC family response regulator
LSVIRVILVEDDETLSRVLARELRELGFEVRAYHTAAGVAECIREFQPHVAIVDLKLPGKGGLELLQELRALDDDLQVVILTGHGGIPEAVEAMRLGAYDFLAKPTQLDVLEQTLRRAAEKTDLLAENRRLRRAASSSGDRPRFLGASEEVTRLLRLVSRIGPTDSSVLIQGENGTGKELIARELHSLSARAGAPLVVVNCGAIPDELVESELFGHEKGAFTGADRRRVGLFEAADGGTLFLDEVGELPLSVQPALLRVLQFGEVRPVGSIRTRTVNVRVISATNQDLAAAARDGGFREDLFYRLCTFQIDVAPLRARPDDVPVLARAFLATASARTERPLRWSDAALARLRAHPWHGNVRELENAVTRLSVLASGPEITEEDVVLLAFGPVVTGRGSLPTLNIPQLERLAISAALERHGGSKPAAAEELGISLRTLYNRLEKDDPTEGDGDAAIAAAT